MAALQQATRRARPLFKDYKTFTHGGAHWSDNYRLEYWADNRQPVVYKDEIYHGYPLIRRLGCWSWLTKDPRTKKYSTVKFLSYPKDEELCTTQFISDHAKSPYVCKITDSFTIPHRLSHMEKYKDIGFQAMVYPLLGSDVRRVLFGQETYMGDPLLTDIPERPERIIRQVVRAVADLHRIGVVHADIHLGNVGLPPPSDDSMAAFLTKPPLEHKVVRKDGKPTPPSLPNRVVEPEFIGFGNEDWCQLFDFGYSFRPPAGTLYSSDHFPCGTSLAPEVLRPGALTSLPYKVDSWQLGLLMYYILCERQRPFDLGLCEDETREQYREVTKCFKHGEDEFFDKVPTDVKKKYIPIIAALWDEDPRKRLSVTELSKDTNFMLDI